MFGGPISFKPVVFTESPELIPDVRAEYYIDGKQIKFHFWANPKFPDNFGESITKAFINVPKDNIIVDYVPEVESWYAEIKEAAFTPTGPLAQRLIAKIGKVVTNARR